MAIRDLLWACPLCGPPARLRAQRRGDRCERCGTHYRRGPGSMIVANPPAAEPITHRAAQWLDMLPRLDQAAEEMAQGPEPVEIRIARGREALYDGDELLGWAESYGPRLRGTLTITPEHLRLDAFNAGTIELGLDRITAVQPSSATLQIKARAQPVVEIRFIEASVRLWESRIQQALRKRYREEGRGEIVEFQPRVTSH